MSPPRSPTAHVSLPSINELFPEHLLTNPPPGTHPYSPSSYRTSPPAPFAPSSTHSSPNIPPIAGSSEHPRLPHSSAFEYPRLNGDAAMAAITKPRPAFRVMMSPHEAGSAMDVARSPELSHYENGDEQRRLAFPPNVYLSVPTTPAGVSSMQQPDEADSVPGSEEKRHRCPHCNKRFNRPSSLNIHVNTHTGAKPFVCRYPGCNRRFNVNSNMRRHYRNHLTARRRDAVARMMPESPSPPGMSASPSRSPEPPHHPTAGYPDPYAPAQYHADPRGRPYPGPEYTYGYTYDYDRQHEHEHEHERRAYPYSPPPSARAKSEAGDADFGVPESSVRDERERCRLRANSSPVPRFREERTRPRASSCNVPGCDCATPISTALRPAFTETDGRPLPAPSPLSRPLARQLASAKMQCAAITTDARASISAPLSTGDRTCGARAFSDSGECEILMRRWAGLEKAAGRALWSDVQGLQGLWLQIVVGRRSRVGIKAMDGRESERTADGTVGLGVASGGCVGRSGVPLMRFVRGERQGVVGSLGDRRMEGRSGICKRCHPRRKAKKARWEASVFIPLPQDQTMVVVPYNADEDPVLAHVIDEGRASPDVVRANHGDLEGPMK
ncbi:predicted protein [Postia placenta Mad-698-R]|uniref:C2H2-type domain-containing protein n=1 Tax=Postia placenta MAD-698-R-SB12 TaxID=670580 RepID=A0A1X6MWC8_9APHY|nr:hypothetical protein POSPLADRAFT_1147280 [Postia placenta MAD-698-R-SB12]EED84399.1 predicted protein [Postia placenta Mad-698-R]OSX60661.1 hypothetical protein POSPLADRAFT_1147280 [Postia placenta MAD-698-R-SB12]